MQHSGMFTPTVAFVANGWRENMQFSNAHIYVGLFVLLLVVASNAFSKTPFDEENTKFWKTQNTVGFRRQLFAWTRASIRSLYCVKSWIFEGYAKYSKSNAFFGIPTIDRGWLMVVPPRQIKKLYSLPDDVLDHHTTANNSIQTRWTIWDEAVSENDFQMNVIRNQITKNLDILTPTIALELEKGFEREWGTSSDWKPISVWTSALSLIAGAANGVFCGAPLCRDMEFLARLRDHAMALFIGAIMINSTPRPFRFVTGNLVGWLCYILLQRVSARCLPFVRQRLGETAKLKANPDHDWVPPKDGLQWIIDECYATGDPSQLDPRRITHRLAFINDISMHSTSYTVQNLLLDLASSEPSLGYIEALREEASRVFHESGGSWTRQSVNKLKLIDSTIRESMRLSPFNSVGLPRTVIHPQGVNVQQGNTTLNIPSGTLVGIPVEAIHYDEAVYQDACTFRPFRFTEPDAVRDIIDATGEATYKDSDATDKAAAVPAKQKSSATIDDAFLGFGFGRHACPGRFFALNEIKIFIAHMVLHYDIQHITVPRQKMTPMIWLNVPFFKDLRVNIRRRTSSP